MRTRKRCYGEEVSQSSSNKAYVDRSRPKQFDQQEGKRPRVASGKRQKRQKKSKERSFFTFDMSGRDAELIDLLSNHNATYMNLLEQVCSGQDPSMGTFRNNLFWINFADQLCRKCHLENRAGMALACQHYCDSLRASYIRLRKEGGPNPINGLSPEYWAKMNRIFAGRTPSTSTGRSPRSTGSVSCGSGRVKKFDLREAIAQLTFSGVMHFDDIERVEKYVTKCKTSEHVFMSGTHEYRVNLVREFLEKDLKNKF